MRTGLPSIWAGGKQVYMGQGQVQVLIAAHTLFAHRQSLLGFAVFHLPVTQGYTSRHRHTPSNTHYRETERERDREKERERKWRQ